MMREVLQDPPVPGYVQQINKLSNTVVSSATIALIRALALRPSAIAEPPANIPPWYAEQYKARASWQAFLRQVRKQAMRATWATCAKVHGRRMVAHSLFAKHAGARVDRFKGLTSPC